MEPIILAEGYQELKVIYVSGRVPCIPCSADVDNKTTCVLTVLTIIRFVIQKGQVNLAQNGKPGVSAGSKLPPCGDLDRSIQDPGLNPGSWKNNRLRLI